MTRRRKRGRVDELERRVAAVREHFGKILIPGLPKATPDSDQAQPLDGCQQPNEEPPMP